MRSKANMKSQHLLQCLNIRQLRHIELELFVPSNILVPRNKPISKHSHLHEGGGKNPVSNYAASILNATIIRRTCTSKGPLSDFAGHMNNSAYV